MQTNAQKTYEWNKKFKVSKIEDVLDDREMYGALDRKLYNRYAMILEELQELVVAYKDFWQGDTHEVRRNGQKEVIDAIADILFVVYGAAYEFGFDIDEAFDRVYKSNMSKLGEDGQPIFNDLGKVQKGPNFVKPDLDDLVIEELNYKDDTPVSEGDGADNE